MSAPYIIACANFPSAIFPSGITTYALMPALVAYAAAAALVFPVEAQTIALAPSYRFCYSHHHPAIFE